MADAHEARPEEPAKAPAPPRAVSAPPPPTDPLWARLGEASALGLGAALIASLPVALRATGEGGSPIGGLVAAAGVLTLPLALLVHASRAAGRAYRMITGRG